jgi:hypothetical protein
MNMNAITELQQWYLSQCNDDWEHSYGVKIDTLDNPGWSLVIDLENTELESSSFETVDLNMESDNKWIHCEVKNKQFKGACGPLMLNEMVAIFTAWIACI